MISVKKDYNDIPAILESEEVEKFREAWKKRYYEENEYYEPKINSKIYTDQSVVDALNEIYHNKCAICERKYSTLTVSHYRPITIYPWLAYEWSNLFLLCSDCNKARRERFLLENEKKRIIYPPKSFYDWRANSKLLLGEAPLLLNPEIHNVEKLLDLNLNGELSESGILFVENASDSAEATIEIYDLNRMDLMYAREKALNRFISDFSFKLNEYLKNDFKQLNDKNFLTVTDNFFNPFFIELKASLMSTNEYSFVYKYLYENFIKFLTRGLKNGAYKKILDSLYKIYVAGNRNTIFIMNFYNLLIDLQKNGFEETEKSSFNPFSKKPITVFDESKLESIEIKNFFSIQNLSIKDLSKKKEVYFLGENGDGKTLLLQGVLIAMKQKSIKHLLSSSVTGKILDIIEPKPTSNLLALQYLKLSSEETLLASGYDNNFIKPLFNAMDDANNSYGQEFDNSYKSIFGYGVSRSRNDSDKKDITGFMTLFDSDRYLQSPVKWLQYLHSKDLERAANINSIDTIPLPIAKEILENLLGEGKDLEIEVTADAVYFKEKSTHISFEQLSEGYKSVMTWVCDLLTRLAENQPNVTDIKDYQGIVLVDEIDLHLHPKWANKIVSKLRTWFPNIQFFFTTHSPIVLLGASRDAVFYKVYKEDGVTKISQPLESISSLTANTILTSPLFGLEDAIADSFDVDKDEPNTEDHYWDSIIHEEIAKRLGNNAGATDSEIRKIVNEELDRLEGGANRDKN